MFHLGLVSAFVTTKTYNTAVFCVIDRTFIRIKHFLNITHKYLEKAYIYTVKSYFWPKIYIEGQTSVILSTFDSEFSRTMYKP